MAASSFCPPNKVMIYEDRQSRCVSERWFRSEVKSVRLHQDRIVVVLLHKIVVFNFYDYKQFDTIVTVENPKGLCEVEQKSRPAVLAYPGLHQDQIRVEHYGLSIRVRILGLEIILGLVLGDHLVVENENNGFINLICPYLRCEFEMVNLYCMNLNLL
ncbi:autophagy-related protein 18c-like [Rosa rugosa]|uniref:autophagy-related protein 18c-like n=1 Tax=Rosa rugosa TaxID=74645 RepID=UPI002B407A39|nr:autophagy-related protein 18c-like [Rosa rugosa]